MTGDELRKLRKGKNLTQKQLSVLSGVPEGTISRIEASKNEEVKKSEVEKALKAVLTNAVPESSAPYYQNVNASAGLSFLTDNSDNNPTSYIKVPGLRVDAYINVFGDSMYPKYESGQIIGIKKIEKDMIHFGYAYVVEMNDGEAYIKYIQPGTDSEHWSLESENKHYTATEFHLSKIRSIFKIKSILKRESL